MLKFLFRTSALVAVILSMVIGPTISNLDTRAVPKAVSATAPVPETKNVIVAEVKAKEDDRAAKLALYFSTKKSPLAPYAGDFVTIADKYDIDWTLLPAITGAESTFGLFVPAYSFNPYGWNNGKYRFESWVAATEIVAYSLRTRYVPVGEITPFVIGSKYAESPNWANKVAAYQREINLFATR